MYLILIFILLLLIYLFLNNQNKEFFLDSNTQYWTPFWFNDNWNTSVPSISTYPTNPFFSRGKRWAQYYLSPYPNSLYFNDNYFVNKKQQCDKNTSENGCSINL